MKINSWHISLKLIWQARAVSLCPRRMWPCITAWGPSPTEAILVSGKAPTWQMKCTPAQPSETFMPAVAQHFNFCRLGPDTRWGNILSCGPLSVKTSNCSSFPNDRYIKLGTAPPLFQQPAAHIALLENNTLITI